jgi:hypothetical protein
MSRPFGRPTTVRGKGDRGFENVAAFHEDSFRYVIQSGAGNLTVDGYANRFATALDGDGYVVREPYGLLAGGGNTTALSQKLVIDVSSPNTP